MLLNNFATVVHIKYKHAKECDTKALTQVTVLCCHIITIIASDSIMMSHHLNNQ